MRPIDHTHDPATRSWLDSANAATDFPVQNLPFGVFRRAGSAEAFRGGVAIGDQIVDLENLAAHAGDIDNPFQGLAHDALQAAAQPSLNALMALPPAAWRALRHALFNALRADAAPVHRRALAGALRPQAEAEHALPAKVGNYTDFFTSIHHVRNAGRQFDGGGKDPVNPNFRSQPIAYHGRASSVVVSGTPVRRPWGQLPRLPADGGGTLLAPTAKLDHELELALWIGGHNPLGQPVALDDAEDRLFGIGLLNDWSARDVQAWEMAPLGPFLAKNFATSVSPWIVTLDALAPFRCAWGREAADGAPQPYLDSPQQRQHGGFDIALEVTLLTPARRAAGGRPVRLSATGFHHQYWTPAQMVAHHTLGGCNLLPGDLCGTGTISGPTDSEAGALLELTLGGRQPVHLPLHPSDGSTESRAFLHDGDELTLRGWCERAGAARIGFGTCAGQVLPAL